MTETSETEAPAAAGEKPADAGQADAAGRFSPEVVAAVARHMNDDHAADTVLMCRALSGVPTATSATVIGVDSTGLDVRVTVDGQQRDARIAFSGVRAQRSELRTEIAALYHHARSVLDLPPDDRSEADY